MATTNNQTFQKNEVLALLYSSERRLAQKIVRLWHSGMNIADISKKLDISYQKACEVLY